jgi:hypothetical protein
MTSMNLQYHNPPGLLGCRPHFCLLVLGLFGICVQPLHEAGLLPVREYRTDNELTDNPGIEAPQRSIIVVSYIDNLPGGII